VKGARRQPVTMRLRFSRYAPSGLRAQLPLARQLRLIVKRPEWQLPRQSGFAGPEAVADAERYRQSPQHHPEKLIAHKNKTTPSSSMKHLADIACLKPLSDGSAVELQQTTSSQRWHNAIDWFIY